MQIKLQLTATKNHDLQIPCERSHIQASEENMEVPTKQATVNNPVKVLWKKLLTRADVELSVKKIKRCKDEEMNAWNWNKNSGLRKDNFKYLQ